MKRLTAANVEKSIRKFHGNVLKAAEELQVARTSLYDYIGKRPTLKAILQDVREGCKDNVESRLYASALQGEAWAVCFFLKTQAKDRGYVEKTMISGDSESPVRHEHEHIVTLTAADIAAATALVGMARGDLSPHGGPQPVHTTNGKAH